ncbi:hypothetical protein N7509_008404 [Penicillium cosmopolitanum]|uniref:FAR-17a/AIG1-like protein n=1 Tax=Penicillium cosmopolitanum TaxID=1131564 RepID=A0A9X0B2M5_9EURO|nr:uncharacterized protein N7509_008404 [Penicillium cosmopolitanum]KAJ5385863.1 hypothetical protein N7509_008404 [Penicillium cosmopolitanum]
MSRALIEKHPLQWLHSPSRGISTFVHLTGLASFTWSFKYMHENPNHANEAYGWHFQYLTVIGLSLSTLTFIFAILADVTLSRRLFLIKNLLSVCSAPLEVLISVLYWGLRLIDERLVVPDWAVIPLDAGMWLNPGGPLAETRHPAFVGAVCLLIHFGRYKLSRIAVHIDADRSSVSFPPWTITVLPSMGLSGAIAFGYWFWVERCASYNGWYPYPIFEQLPTPGRVALFSLSAVVMAFSTATLKWLHGRVNGFGVPIPAQSRSGEIKRADGL